VRAAGFALDATLGSVQRPLITDAEAIALHGGDEIEGVLNNLGNQFAPGITPEGLRIDYGTSYVQTVTFDDRGPVAQAMLTYGQSTDPASPHATDQLRLFSKPSSGPRCPSMRTNERPDQCRSIHQILDHFWMIAQYIGFGSIWCRHLVGPVEHCSSQSARENPIGRYAFKEARTFFRVGLKEQLPCRVGIRPLTILDDSRQVLCLHLVGQGLGCVVSEN
jgi:hypothetical protein